MKVVIMKFMHHPSSNNCYVDVASNDIEALKWTPKSCPNNIGRSVNHDGKRTLASFATRPMKVKMTRPSNVPLSRIVMVFYAATILFVFRGIITLCNYHNNTTAPFMEILNSFFAPSLRVSDDEIFANAKLSGLTYSKVRQTWNKQRELSRDLKVVKLPHDFNGQYNPRSLEEFEKLATDIISPALDDDTFSSRKSKYGIVSICVGMDICPISEQNHRSYASKHGYDYILLSRNVRGV